MDIDEFVDKARQIEAEIARVMVGQKQIIRHSLIALLAGGNVLLEGVPGLGKTMLVKTLSQVLSLDFKRVQFTPDLMPADIVGTSIISEDAEGRRAFQFQPGPVFANIVLADEINRATPKTQSALLEAMQERTVTAGGKTRKLPHPFFVLATQNPLEMEGTYPLPEAQTDRFLFKLLVEFPAEEELAAIISRDMASDPGDLDSQRGRSSGHAGYRCRGAGGRAGEPAHSKAGFGQSSGQSLRPGNSQKICTLRSFAPRGAGFAGWCPGSGFDGGTL